jgi:hypothetical protein
MIERVLAESWTELNAAPACAGSACHFGFDGHPALCASGLEDLAAAGEDEDLVTSMRRRIAAAGGGLPNRANDEFLQGGNDGGHVCLRLTHAIFARLGQSWPLCWRRVGTDRGR